MTDYNSLVQMLFAPARAMTAQPPKANLGGGWMEKLHNAIDPVQAFGGYGNMMAMALPPGAKVPARGKTWYHGTQEAIDPNKLDPSELFFVTDSPELASWYASGGAGAPRFPGDKVGPNVLPVRIKGRGKPSSFHKHEDGSKSVSVPGSRVRSIFSND